MPIINAKYVATYPSQTDRFDVWSIQIGSSRIIVATINGIVAHHDKGPWIWNSEKDAQKQIAKWR